MSSICRQIAAPMPVAPPVTIGNVRVAHLRHQGQNAQRAARALLDLERRRDDHGALRRQQVEIGQALQAVAALAMHVEMRGIGGIEMLAPGRCRCRSSRCRNRARRAPRPATSRRRASGRAYGRRPRACRRNRRIGFFDQSVRSNIQLPASILPCLPSHASTKGTVSAKSASAAASFEQSRTTAGAMNFRGVDGVHGIVRAGPCPRSNGSARRNACRCARRRLRLFQYQAGPRSS